MGFVREVGLMSQCNVAIIVVFATERLVIVGKRRKGEPVVTTEDFFAIKQELEGRQSEESISFGEEGCSLTVLEIAARLQRMRVENC